MSVDQRIREGLGTIDTGLMPVDTDAALARTMRRAGRSRARRRVAGGLVAAAATIAAVAAVRFDAVPDSAPPVSDPPDAGTVHAQPTELDGTWRSEPLSLRDMTDRLREEGLGEWVPEFRRQTGRFHGLPARMSFQDESMDYRLPGHAEDSWRFAVDDDSLAFVDRSGTLVNVYALSLGDDGRTMSLRLRTPSTGSWAGIPHEVYQTAFFTTKPFHRVD
jgi:hypothetical protein